MSGDGAQLDEARNEELSAQTVALRLIAAVLLVGAAWQLSALLVPFLLALVLAVALSPLASRIEGAGLPRALASLVCTLIVVLALGLALGLVLYQAGSIVQDSDRYLKGFADRLSSLARRTGGDRLARSFGVLEAEAPVVSNPSAPNEREARRPEGEPARRVDDSGGARPTGSATSSPAGRPVDWQGLLRRNVEALSRWLISGLGGLMGFLGGLVVFLAFLFYMIQARAEWVERITLALARLGFRPRSGQLQHVQHEVVTYIGCLSLVSLGYTALVTLVLWLVGVPQPLLWGVLAGLLEAVPYFGPLIAAVLPTIVALSLGSWWQPAAVIGQYLGLHLLESYVVAPLLYGRAVRLDPVTILFGALFFGWLFGPLGLAIATPLLVMLRGLLIMTPDTPALDALADVKAEKRRAASAPG